MRFVLALLLLLFIRTDYAYAAPATLACPDDVPRPVAPPKLSLPQSAHITSNEIAFAIDIGSDARVRNIALLQSSGDIGVDALVREALQKSAYRPARSHCVAISSTIRSAFRLGDASPAPPGTPAPMLHPESCVPPVNAFVSPLRRDGGKRGTTIVAVDLDAAGALTGARISQSSTVPILDTEALAAARSASYSFANGSPCLRQSTIYFLELSFE